MLKYIQNFFKKIHKTNFRKGYLIRFHDFTEEPDFKDYHLHEIGIWMKSSGEFWLCTSEITNTEKFTQLFLEKTALPPAKITIEEGHFPSLTGL